MVAVCAFTVVKHLRFTPARQSGIEGRRSGSRPFHDQITGGGKLTHRPALAVAGFGAGGSTFFLVPPPHIVVADAPPYRERAMSPQRLAPDLPLERGAILCLAEGVSGRRRP
jgi:hypothetical protein